MPLSDNNIFSHTMESWERILLSLNLKKYRLAQIIDWVYKKRIWSFSQMSNLSNEDRELLEGAVSSHLLKMQNKFVSADGTVKYLFGLGDGEIIETVLMKNRYGYSVCVSTQVGCNMGCVFCYSGLAKKKRNLLVYEMVQQIVLVEQDMGFRISNVVVMGIGEPFDNYDNLISFLKIINNDSMLQIGARHITVSTSGIIDKIYEFEQSGLNVNLAVSLHSVFQAKREKIMPIAKAFDIKSLNKAIFHYLTTTKKKITLEYIMIGNFNDLDEDIEQIVKMYKNKNVYVNLIPLNGNLNKDLKSSTDERVEYFFDTLIKAGIQTIIRRTQGDDINAACGQLRISLSKNDGK